MIGTIEPIVIAIVEEMSRKFLTKTGSNSGAYNSRLPKYV